MCKKSNKLNEGLGIQKPQPQIIQRGKEIPKPAPTPSHISQDSKPYISPKNK